MGVVCMCARIIFEGIASLISVRQKKKKRKHKKHEDYFDFHLIIRLFDNYSLHASWILKRFFDRQLKNNKFIKVNITLLMDGKQVQRKNQLFRKYLSVYRALCFAFILAFRFMLTLYIFEIGMVSMVISAFINCLLQWIAIRKSVWSFWVK